MASRWDGKDYRDGWFAGRASEKKRRLLWIFVGVCFREIALFVVWALTHT